MKGATTMTALNTPEHRDNCRTDLGGEATQVLTQPQVDAGLKLYDEMEPIDRRIDEILAKVAAGVEDECHQALLDGTDPFAWQRGYHTELARLHTEMARLCKKGSAIIAGRPRNGRTTPKRRG